MNNAGLIQQRNLEIQNQVKKHEIKKSKTQDFKSIRLRQTFHKIDPKYQQPIAIKRFKHFYQFVQLTSLNRHFKCDSLPHFFRSQTLVTINESQFCRTTF